MDLENIAFKVAAAYAINICLPVMARLTVHYLSNIGELPKETTFFVRFMYICIGLAINAGIVGVIYVASGMHVDNAANSPVNTDEPHVNIEEDVIEYDADEFYDTEDFDRDDEYISCDE